MSGTSSRGKECIPATRWVACSAPVTHKIIGRGHIHVRMLYVGSSLEMWEVRLRTEISRDLDFQRDLVARLVNQRGSWWR